MSKILFIIGTRPELIKVAPVIHELQRRGIHEYTILNTAQHKDLLEPYWDIFGIKPTCTLDVMQAGQSLSGLSARAIVQIQDFLDSQPQKPAVIVAIGDTTTVMASAMVAFYNRIQFAHLEAGLRSLDFESPFPEEYNRRVAGISTTIHLAPTEKSRQNLLREGFDDATIRVVGNTVIDTLQYITASPHFAVKSYSYAPLNVLKSDKLVLLTCHRRENHGENLQEILRAINDLAITHTEYIFIWLLHPNPNVKATVEKSALALLPNVLLTPPLDYWDILKLMQKTAIIISDSGGIQEEAPSFGVPILVLREKTDRPEGVDAGVARLVGANYDKIINGFTELQINNRKLVKSPYGDGLAAERVVNELLLF